MVKSSILIALLGVPLLAGIAEPKPISINPTDGVQLRNAEVQYMAAEINVQKLQQQLTTAQKDETDKQTAMYTLYTSLASKYKVDVTKYTFNDQSLEFVPNPAVPTKNDGKK